MTLPKIDLIVLILLLHEATLVVQTHLQLNYVRFNIVATSIMIILLFSLKYYMFTMIALAVCILKYGWIENRVCFPAQFNFQEI